MPAKMNIKSDSSDIEEKGKLFVGGLSWETTQENLKSYFGRFGEVVDCVVMKNNESGRSRGFGFITFADPSHIDLVIQNGPHQLDSRTIDPKVCNPRGMAKPRRGSNYPKVFLGGLPSNLTETDLRNYFTAFGKVMDVVIMFDQEQKKSRGFGFLSFETADSVERLVSEHYVTINGKQIEIKRAEPRESKMGGGGNMGSNGWSGPSGGPHMNMGGGMGQMNSGGPMGGMGGPMMQGYQGWGAPQGYPSQGYGPPQSQGYQGWGAPPGQNQMQPQWGPGGGYGGPPQPQGFGPPASGPAPGPIAPSGPANPGPKPGSDYGSYGNQYGNYPQSGNHPYQQPSAGSGPPDYNYGGGAPSYGPGGDSVSPANYAGGPGPQRGGNYSQPQSQTGFHPYRR